MLTIGVMGHGCTPARSGYPAPSPSFEGGFPWLSPEGRCFREHHQDTIAKNKIAVFMKGTPAQPKCGFSAAVVDILNRMNVPYVGVDAIEDPRFRHVLSAHTEWPTLPQVFVGGKLDRRLRHRPRNEGDRRARSRSVAEAIEVDGGSGGGQAPHRAGAPGSEVSVTDLTGGGDHLAIVVTAPQFAGVGLIDQHRMIHAALITRCRRVQRAEIRAESRRWFQAAGARRASTPLVGDRQGHDDDRRPARIARESDVSLTWADGRPVEPSVRKN